MSRLQALDPAAATGKAQALLDGVRKKLGLVPNMIRTMASSPAVLEGAVANFRHIASDVWSTRRR